MCVCLCSIFVNVGVILGLWHCRKPVGWVWEQCWCWSGLRIL